MLITTEGVTAAVAPTNIRDHLPAAIQEPAFVQVHHRFIARVQGSNGPQFAIGLRVFLTLYLGLRITRAGRQ